MNRLLIIGPPGAGKGTQAARIAEERQLPAISTGDIFRENIRNSTELGQEAKQYIDAGNLVPDSVTNRMVRDRLGQEDAREGFLLDGYPRNPAQVEELDRILTDLGQDIDAVLLLTADQEELVQRLLKRAEEQGRSDDTEDVIRHRLEVYEKETAPVVDLYEQRGLVRRIDGLGGIDEVTQRLLDVLS